MTTPETTPTSSRPEMQTDPYAYFTHGLSDRALGAVAGISRTLAAQTKPEEVTLETIRGWVADELGDVVGKDVSSLTATKVAFAARLTVLNS